MPGKSNKNWQSNHLMFPFQWLLYLNWLYYYLNFLFLEKNNAQDNYLMNAYGRSVIISQSVFRWYSSAINNFPLNLN